MTIRFLSYWVEGTKPKELKGIEVPYVDCQEILETIDKKLGFHKRNEGFRRENQSRLEYTDIDSYGIQVNDLDAIAIHGLEAPLISVHVEEFEEHTLENLVRNVGLLYDWRQTDEA